MKRRYKTKAWLCISSTVCGIITAAWELLSVTSSGAFDGCFFSFFFILISSASMMHMMLMNWNQSALCGWNYSWYSCCIISEKCTKKKKDSPVRRRLNVNEWQQRGSCVRKCQPRGSQNTCKLFHLLPANPPRAHSCVQYVSVCI